LALAVVPARDALRDELEPDPLGGLGADHLLDVGVARVAAVDLAPQLGDAVGLAVDHRLSLDHHAA
jgi:hypothetical protein